MTEDRRTSNPSRPSPRSSSSLPGGNTKSKILLHPNAASGQPARRATASLHPQHFTRDFDLIGELSSNRELYTGDQDLTLYALPNYLRTCLDRARGTLNTQGVKVGLKPLTACVLLNGLHIIMGNANIKSLIKIRKILDTTKGVPADELEELVSFLRQYNVTFPDSTSHGHGKLNLKVPSEIKDELGGAAAQLGVSSSALGIMAIAVTLEEEESMLPERRKEIGLALEGFWRRTQIRRVVTEVWVGQLGIRVPNLGLGK